MCPLEESDLHLQVRSLMCCPLYQGDVRRAGVSPREQISTKFGAHSELLAFSVQLNIMRFNVPQEVQAIANDLTKKKFQAYLVGGCVRDLLMGRVPKDWDIATNANPGEVQRLFPESVYENAFGTVGVKTGSENDSLKIIEVTTFRLEGKYSDKRHPDEITFAKTIEEDLSRRDFTINAIALSLTNDQRLMTNDSHKSSIVSHGLGIVDPYGGEKDMKKKTLRTVGTPEERFEEDALRLMRAVRLATELGFTIDTGTEFAIRKHAGLLEMIAKERVRDELIKILMNHNAGHGMRVLQELHVLPYSIPELQEGVGVGQNKHHIYTVFEHSIRALEYAVKEGSSLLVRVASLLHDVGKPRSKRGEGPDSTFYNHEVIGAELTAEILERLHFPKDFIEKAAHLVRSHMFYYNVDEVSPAGVRRFLARVGPENVDDLMKVREADRIGSGVPKAAPYKLRHLLFMIEKVKKDPISPKMLKINGADLMRALGINPGPRIGYILSILLEEVIDDPEKNNRAHLERRAQKLNEYTDGELKKLAAKAEETKEEFEIGIEEEIKRKYSVK